MKKILFSLVAVGLGLALFSCSSAKKAMSPDQLSGEWNIIAVDGKDIPTPMQGEPVPFLGLDWAQKRVYGIAGCNRMMGSFEADTLAPGKISFGPLATTRMACPDMSIEQSILTALAKVKSYQDLPSQGKDAPAEVSFNDEKGGQVLLLRKNEPAGINALKGIWAIRTIVGQAVASSEKTPFLGFDPVEKRLYGNAGCNSFSGPFEMNPEEPTSLVPGAIAATMMMCPDMATETAVLKALNEVTSFKLTGNTLSLCDAQGSVLIDLEKDDTLGK